MKRIASSIIILIVFLTSCSSNTEIKSFDGLPIDLQALLISSTVDKRIDEEVKNKKIVDPSFQYTIENKNLYTFLTTNAGVGHPIHKFNIYDESIKLERGVIRTGFDENNIDGYELINSDNNKILKNELYDKYIDNKNGYDTFIKRIDTTKNSIETKNNYYAYLKIANDQIKEKKYLPKGAFKGAGGPIPKNATRITSILSQSGFSDTIGNPVIKTPTKNIGCEIFKGSISCGVISILDSETKYKRTDANNPHGLREWVVNFSEKEKPYLSDKNDAPTWLMDETQIVQYGKTVYYDNFVCHSAENGLTCWNSNTGYGAFINRDGFNLF